MRRLEVVIESFPLRSTFVISRGARTEAMVVAVTLSEDGVVGRGECVPYARYGESPEGVAEQIGSVAEAIADGADRARLLDLLPAGAARNALDGALWDLEAQRGGMPAWRLAGLVQPPRVQSVRTLSLGTPESMAEEAVRCRPFPVLKLKLGGVGDEERVAAVRTAAPRARLIADANESWRVDDVEERLRRLAALGVEMVEQPLPAAADQALEGLDRALPLCADESFHVERDLDRAARRYDLVNLKLDKTGGLTAALALRRAAEERGLGIMVGCMVATSLGIAPALPLAQGARYVDLDGPYLLARDRQPPLGLTEDGVVSWEPRLWGG